MLQKALLLMDVVILVILIYTDALLIALTYFFLRTINSKSNGTMFKFDSAKGKILQSLKSTDGRTYPNYEKASLLKNNMICQTM